MVKIRCPVVGCDWGMSVSGHTDNMGVIMARNDMEIHLRGHTVNELVSVAVTHALTVAKEAE